MLPQHRRRLERFAVPIGCLASAALHSALFIQISHSGSAFAAWDLRHAAAVEDLLKEYISTLPRGRDVPPPRLFIYQGKAFSRACPNSGIDAPAYCPGDHTVYLETSLGNQVAESFGDFGALSILAHEFGHAYLNKLRRHPQGKEGELAADAFAGGFARYVEGRGLLEPGDVGEARATFAAVGDYQVYHHDHHGTPKERRQAFDDGYLVGFRLPGESGPLPSTPPVIQPQSPGQEVGSSPQGQALPPAAPAESPSASALPILGLGLGVLLFGLILAGVVTMVNRAKDSDL
jgi:hypothetical protein